MFANFASMPTTVSYKENVSFTSGPLNAGMFMEFVKISMTAQLKLCRCSIASVNTAVCEICGAVERVGVLTAPSFPVSASRTAGRPDPAAHLQPAGEARHRPAAAAARGVARRLHHLGVHRAAPGVPRGARGCGLRAAGPRSLPLRHHQGQRSVHVLAPHPETSQSGYEPSIPSSLSVTTKVSEASISSPPTLKPFRR